MASAVASLWRPADPAQIEAELSTLWCEAAREGPVSRALMSNLIVVRHSDAPSPPAASYLEPDSDLVHIARLHPVRMILLNYAPDSHPPSAPAQAETGVVMFGSGPARYGIEVIAVDALCAEASVPSIARRLTRGDVPTTLWWTTDLSRSQPSAGLIESGRQLVYDSAAWQDVPAGARAAAAVAALPFAPDLADLNWQRLATLRAAVVQVLTGEPHTGSLQAHEVTLSHRPDHLAAAQLMGAWLRRGLGWQASPKVEAADDGDDDLVVHINAGDSSITAAASRLRVEVTGAGGQPPFSMAVPQNNLATTMLNELRNLGHDVVLRETVSALAATLG